jgi:hypothetical protein
VARCSRIRSSSRTLEIVTWTIGVLVVVGVWLLIADLVRHL